MDSFLIKGKGQFLVLSHSVENPSGLNLCRPSVCCHSLCDFMCANPVLYGMHCFLRVIHPLWHLHIEPQVLGGGLQWRHSGLNALESLILCTLSRYRSPIYYKCKLLWWWLHEPLIWAYSRMASGVILLLYSFSRIWRFEYEWPS